MTSQVVLTAFCSLLRLPKIFEILSRYFPGFQRKNRIRGYTVLFFSGDNRPDPEADHTFLVWGLRVHGATSPLHHTPSGRGVLRHRNSFAFHPAAEMSTSYPGVCLCVHYAADNGVCASLPEGEDTFGGGGYFALRGNDIRDEKGGGGAKVPSRTLLVSVAIHFQICGA